MKTIASALLALSVLAGIAASASASHVEPFDAQKFFEDLKIQG
jgi:hypothetical protein